MPSAAELTAIFKEDWRSRPLYRALARELRDAVASGELAPHERLPSERALASALGVSRSTIVSAYDALREGGWVASRSGSGTFVAVQRGSAPLRMRDMVDDVAAGPGRSDGTSGLINLSVSKPRPLAAMLNVALGESAATISRLAEQVEYAPQGLPELRRLIADSFSDRGLPTSAAQVIVTTGAQQAIGLVAQLFVEAGDPAMLESPTYLGALDVLRARRARLVALPAADGFDAERAVALACRTGPKLLFVMPTCHTVTGAVIDEGDRERLARFSSEAQLPIVEDDIFAGLTLEGETVPPIAAFSDDAPVFTIGSTSKLIWNGLRVGWLRAPEAMMTRLARMKGSADLGTSLLSQPVALQLLQRRETVARVRRQEMIGCRSLISDLLRRALPGWEWRAPAGGRSLWLRLPSGSATAFAQVAARHGTIVVPGPALSPDGGNDDRIRVMFVQPRPLLAEAVERLGLAWSDYTQELR